MAVIYAALSVAAFLAMFALLSFAVYLIFPFWLVVRVAAFAVILAVLDVVIEVKVNDALADALARKEFER